MARIAALLFLACALRAQSVEITFTDSVTRAPIAGLSVTLKGPAELSATTDGAGRARFPNAAPGYYSIGFKSTGNYMPSFTGRGPIHVGDEPVRVSREMIPLARISGRVVFPDGKPAGARVLLTPHRRGGSLFQSTDGQGRFTFDHITPGRYAIAASASYRSKPTDTESWAPVWFPDAPDRASAQPILVRAGADLSGYDVRLRSVSVHRIRGVVRDETGRPAPGAKIQIVDAASPFAVNLQATCGDDGAFEIPALRAGDWRLVAILGDRKGVAAVTLARRDLDNVDIRLSRPFTVEATVERDVLKPATAVSLVPEPDRAELEVLAFHDEDGAALLKKVYPGKYEIRPMGLVPGYYLDSVKLGDRDVLGQLVDIFEGGPPIRVVYESGAAVVRAKVENDAGAFVVLVPQQESFRTDQFIRSAAAGSDVTNLRPGDYYAFAFDRYDRVALEDSAFVRGLVPRAAKVHVEKGETAVLELKVTPWPE